MKFYDVEMKGDFIVEKLSTTPSWTSEDEGRLIYVNNENIVKLGTNSTWVNVGDSIDTSYTLPESNGDLFYDDCSNIKLWEDQDNSSGVSTATNLHDKSVFKFVTGNNTHAGARRQIVKIFPSSQTRVVTSVNIFIDMYTGFDNNNAFHYFLQVDTGHMFRFYINSTGLYVYNSSSFPKVVPSLSKIISDCWVTYTFDIDVSNSVCDVYADSIKMGSDISCCHTQSWTIGTCLIGSYCDVYGNGQITYVDQVKIGTEFTKVSQHDVAGTSKYGINNIPYTPAGYIIGGITGISSLLGERISTIDKLTFSNDNCNSVTSNLSITRYCGAGFSSSDSGYTAGGLAGSYSSTIEKLTFSNDHNNSITSSLQIRKGWVAGFNSTSFGYTAGGSTSSWNYVTTIDKLTFSNDNYNSITSGLSGGRRGVSGFNSTVAGYVSGGYSTASVTTIDKLTFSDDTRSLLSSGLNIARHGTAGFNSSSSGYITGGRTSSGGVIGDKISTIDKLTFSNDNCNEISSHLSSSKDGVSGFNSSSSGYTVGGWTDESTISIIEKLTFSNDNNNNISSSLTFSSQYSTGFNTL